MAVRLRLRRMGRKKNPFYRIVAADQRSPRDGRFIEVVGFYDPLQSPHKLELKEDRVYYWLGQGAQATTTVNSLLRREGILHRLDMQKRGLSTEQIEEEMKKWELLQTERKKRHDAARVQKAKAKAEKVAEEKEEAPAATVEAAEPVVETTPAEETAPVPEAAAEPVEEPPAEVREEPAETENETASDEEVNTDKAEPSADEASKEDK